MQIDPPTPEVEIGPSVHSKRGITATIFSVLSLSCTALSHVTAVSKYVNDVYYGLTGKEADGSAMWIPATLLAAVAIRQALKSIGERGRRGLFQWIGLALALLSVFAAVYLALNHTPDDDDF